MAPVFDFYCTNCGHEELDVILKQEDLKYPLACDKCLSNMERKSVYHTSFELRGSGWYITDYKGK
jgi:predicted nucleic acid-binding Zn ribbon protein